MEDVVDIGSDNTSCIVHVGKRERNLEPAYFDLLLCPPEIMIKTSPLPDFTDMTPLNYERKSIDSLVDSFQNQLTNIDEERGDFNRRLQELAHTAQEHIQALHRINEKDEEIKKLQKSLSDAHIYLYEERGKVLQLQSQNQELSSHNQKIQSELSFYKNTLNPTTQRVDLSLHSTPTSICTKYTGTTNTKTKIKNQKGDCIVRTVYLPSENVDHLHTEIKHLRTKASELERLLRDREKSFMEDRTIREREHALEARNSAAKLLEIQQKHSRITNLQYSTMSDHLALKRQFYAEEVKLQRKIIDLSQDNVQRQKALDLAVVRAKEYAENCREMCTEQVRLYLKQARGQLINFKDELNFQGDEHLKIKNRLEMKLKTMTRKHTDVKKKFKALDTRRKLEIEGFENDIANLRREIYSARY